MLQSNVLSVSVSGVVIRPRPHYSVSLLVLSSAASVSIVMGNLISAYYAQLNDAD